MASPPTTTTQGSASIPLPKALTDRASPVRCLAVLLASILLAGAATAAPGELTPLPLELRDENGKAPSELFAELTLTLAPIARAGRCTPLCLDLLNDGPPRAGLAQLRLEQTIYEKAFELPGSSRRRLVFFVIPYSSELTVRVALRLDSGGVLAGSAQFSLASGSSPRPLAAVFRAPQEPFASEASCLHDVLDLAELDASSASLADPRSYDPLDAVVLTSGALSALRLPARRALLQYLAGGGSALLLFGRGVTRPELALRPWYEMELDGLDSQEVPVDRSDVFPDFGSLHIGGGQLVFLTQTALERACTEQLRQRFQLELIERLQLADGQRAGVGAAGPVQEQWSEIFPRTSWPWRRCARWLVTLGAYVVVMAGFLLPILRRGASWKLYLGAFAASACFAAVLLRLALPQSAAVLQSVAIEHLRSGSTTTWTECWAELSARRETSAELASPQARDLRPLFASWPQLSQSRATVRESTEGISYALTLVKGERRWFCLRSQQKLSSPLRAHLRRLPANAIDSGALELKIEGPLPDDLDRAVLVSESSATPIGRIDKGGPFTLKLVRPYLTLSGAIERAGPPGRPASALMSRLASHWRAGSKGEGPVLLAWSHKPRRAPFTGLFADTVVHPTLYVIELERE